MNGDLKRSSLPAFRHLAVLRTFMEYCEPEPIDYSSKSNDDLERAIQELGRQAVDYQ